MEKISLTTEHNINEVYSDQFSEKGWFIIDKVELRPNNPITNISLVAVIKAHLKDNPSFKVEATSDKFHF